MAGASGRGTTTHGLLCSVRRAMGSVAPARGSFVDLLDSVLENEGLHIPYACLPLSPKGLYSVQMDSHCVTHMRQGRSRTSSMNPRKAIKQMQARAALYSSSHWKEKECVEGRRKHGHV